MNSVATRPADFRQQLFEETSVKMGLAPTLVEKDFWVCWMLEQLFSIPELDGHLIFKGGTTLSKVHDVIQRFSEDIDLTVDRMLLGFVDERDPEKGAE